VVKKNVDVFPKDWKTSHFVKSVKKFMGYIWAYTSLCSDSNLQVIKSKSWWTEMNGKMMQNEKRQNNYTLNNYRRKEIQRL